MEKNNMVTMNSYKESELPELQLLLKTNKNLSH